MFSLTQGIEFILHFDKYLSIVIENYGVWVYAILFLIILLETGFVIAPFLPGDSLLFIAGVFAANGEMNIIILIILLAFAAIAGDSINYSIGRYLGPKVFKYKKEYLERTKNFYEKYGNKTIILARFIPIVRTFAPFVAGIGRMNYNKFLTYNVVGGLIWVLLFTLAGYFFGNIPIIEENLTIVILIIILLSIVPPVIEYIKHKIKK